MATPAPVSAPVSAPVRASEAAPDDAGPRLYGVVDVVKPDRIAGWVIDRRDSRAAVEVEIRREGRLVATVKASRPRRDLEKAGVGTGSYGFTCDIDPPIEPGFEFTLTTTARAGDGTTELLRRPAAQTGSPDRRLLERIFEELRSASEPAALREVVQRIELAQARIEATLAAIEAPAAPAVPKGLRILVGVAIAVAVSSLAIGVVSMLVP